MKEDKKKVFIRNFGCQMNFRDSEFVLGILMDAGFGKADSPGEADIVLFNTCSVRDHAEERAYANIWNIAPLKKVRPGLLVGVIGCMAQAKREKIFRDIPFVDFTCGPDNEPEIASIIRDVLKNRTSVAAVDGIGAARREYIPAYRQEPFRAFVSISYGCDNHCAYCIVPYVRGRERSRLPKDILREVRDLAERGTKDITLLGQNVNSYRGYGGRGADFPRLLEEIEAIPGDFRVRFMTSHPKDASVELFRAMRDLGKVCEHLHLPLQSGSDRILRLMNRGYTVRQYLARIESYRKHVPEGSVTTDVVVGFPSETGRDFNRTRAVFEETRFDSAFIFKYSPRPFTRASKLKDGVPDGVKGERDILLINLQNGITKERNRALIGTEPEVLFEGRNPKVPGGITGRTRTNKTVLTEGPARLIGSFEKVRIDDVTCSTLRGTLAWDDASGGR